VLAKLIVPVFIVVLAGFGILLFGDLFSKAALSITSDPAGEKVVLDGEEVGATPFFSDQLAKGEKTLSFGGFNQKINLTGGALTVVNWVDGPEETFSAGEVIWLSTSANSELLVIAKPGAQVFLDDKEIGASPLSKSVDPGEYTLELKKDGYFTRSIKIAIRAGFRLNVSASLSLNPFPLDYAQDKPAELKELSSPSPSLKVYDLSSNQPLLTGDYVGWAKAAAFWDSRAEDRITYDFYITFEGKLYDNQGSETSVDALEQATGEKAVGYLGDSSAAISSGASSTLNSLSAKLYPPVPMVEILQTGTGFLRVRSGPGTSYSEIGRATPGDKYKYLGEEGDWLKIDFNGQEGWVSKEFSKKI